MTKKISNRAFTLVELLAVIIILGVIALITIPQVLDFIEESKEESMKLSAENYIKGVKNAVMEERLTRKFIPTHCIVQQNGNILCNDETTEIKVNVSGNKPTDGNIYFENGEVVKYSILIKKYLVINDGINFSIPKKNYYKNGEIVYFDVSTGKVCKNYTESQSNTGVKTGCMKFYAFNDTEVSPTLNLILDHNTTATVAWVNKADYMSAGGTEEEYGSYGNNKYGPITVINKLKSDTKDWKGTIEPSNYEYKGSARPYNIDYTGYKARLITANEIAQITGNTSWNETTSTNWYYFQDLTQNTATGNGDVCASKGCKYGWLYDRTSTGCANYGCLNNSNLNTNGYWTSSARDSHSNIAWHVYTTGIAGSSYVNDTNYGVRPVITILKS